MIDKNEELVNNTKLETLEKIKSALIEIKDKEEIYFHDIVHSVVDSNCPVDRKEGLELIDYLGNEKYVESGLIDTSTLDRTIITTAYCCLEMEMFNDDFFQELQDILNNEEISKKQVDKIILKIVDYKIEKGFDVKKMNRDPNNQIIVNSVIYKDNNNQIFIKSPALSRDDFKSPFFTDKQVIKLGKNDLKIFTNNKEMNRNAIVLEKGLNDIYRVYLMNKDNNIDIRDFFKIQMNISEESGWSLDPKDYVEGRITKEFKDKKKLIWVLNQMANKLVEK